MPVPPNVPTFHPAHEPALTPDQRHQLGQQHPPIHLPGMPGTPATGYLANGLAEGTVLDTLYTGQGLTLATRLPGASAATGPVYAAPLPGTWNGYTGSVLTPRRRVAGQVFDPCYDDRDGAIRATFAAPQRTVAVEVSAEAQIEGLLVSHALPYLVAYDAGGRELARATYPVAFGDPGFGSWQTLTVTAATAAVTYAEFGSTGAAHDHVAGAFRRLTYHA